MNKLRGYIFSRPFMGERVPQHVQNLVIREYCERKKYQYLLSATEYAMSDCYLVLEQVVKEMSEISGLVAYSLFQLPEKTDKRKIVYEQITSQQKSIHFAVEGLYASTMHEFNKIETFWQIRLTLPHCPKAFTCK